MKIHEFDPVIYPFKLWVIIEKYPNKIADFFDKYSGEAMIIEESFVESSRVFTMPAMRKDSRDYGAIICFGAKKSITYETVAHECSHAAKYLFEHIDADMKEHEPFEYLIGWMAGCCENVKKLKENEKRNDNKKSR